MIYVLDVAKHSGIISPLSDNITATEVGLIVNKLTKDPLNFSG